LRKGGSTEYENAGPRGSDLTSVALKGRLLGEEALDRISSIACAEPKHILRIEPLFRL
jgi:hypothetical protein